MARKRTAAAAPAGDIIVVQQPRQNSWVAGQIVKVITADGHDVPTLAAAIGVPVQQITEVLDSYDGSFTPPRLVGPGRGGNWLPEGVTSRGEE